MSFILKSLEKVASRQIFDQLSDIPLEKIPSIILSVNVETLMRIRGFTSDKSVSRSITTKGLELSTAQIHRVRKGTSEATGLTLFKLAIGLQLEPTDFMYLYDPAGFTNEGMPLSKVYPIDEGLFIKILNKVYEETAKQPSINIAKLVRTTLNQYRKAISGTKL